MPRVYDDDAFEARVALAASYISNRRNASRTFDTCFEMHDGDYVAAALYRRVMKNPDSNLAANIWRYLCREIVEPDAKKMAHIPTRQLKHEAAKQRAKKKVEFAAWLAEKQAA